MRTVSRALLTGGHEAEESRAAGLLEPGQQLRKSQDAAGFGSLDRYEHPVGFTEIADRILRGSRVAQTRERGSRSSGAGAAVPAHHDGFQQRNDRTIIRSAQAQQ